MWYVMQTATGKEEELAGIIHKTVPGSLYTDCFVAYYERIWRRQQQCIVHTQRLFPGYVFIDTYSPKGLFLELKHIPIMAKLLSDGEYGFIPLAGEEEAFLRAVFKGGRTVKLSYVETDGHGQVLRVTGPLAGFQGRVVKYQFKKRYAVIRYRLFGADKTALLGIMLKEDMPRLAYHSKRRTEASK